MAAFTQNQHFAMLLLIALAGSSAAQIFTQNDRSSILKFMDVLMNVLDLEADNATSTVAPGTPPGTSVETTTTFPSEPAGETTASSDTTSNSTVGDSTSGTTTTLGSDTTTEVTSTTVRPRICFKRICYKFSTDKGYIY
ncbi:endochitinase 2 [Drosophila obscura]|uniref:endochitinase 2 n=1 Tax=Drosophila obscura TaxID=7282 RepID=UPI001BB22CAE|nr:endochitinase 2 [Drosophila obscura]